MQKYAHLVKTAEVRGVLAYLVDSEMVKVASQEDFDSLVEQVTNSLEDENYDLNTVMNKTAELLEEDNTSQEKTAAEAEELVQKEIGKLTMEKTAGNISDEKYELICSGLIKEATGEIGAGMGALRSANLSDDEAQALREHYGLDDDSNLTLRNAGRGFLGGAGGSMAGGVVGGNAGQALLRSGHPVAGAGSAAAGVLGGGLLGANAATKKYSKGNKELQDNKENNEE